MLASPDDRPGEAATLPPSPETRACSVAGQHRADSGVRSERPEPPPAIERQQVFEAPEDMTDAGYFVYAILAAVLIAAVLTDLMMPLFFFDDTIWRMLSQPVEFVAASLLLVVVVVHMFYIVVIVCNRALHY